MSKMIVFNRCTACEVISYVCFRQALVMRRALHVISRAGSGMFSVTRLRFRAERLINSFVFQLFGIESCWPRLGGVHVGLVFFFVVARCAGKEFPLGDTNSA